MTVFTSPNAQEQCLYLAMIAMVDDSKHTSTP